MAKLKKVIVKSVCLDCIGKISLNLEHQIVLCGKNFECEWCDNIIQKFEKYAQFYRMKQ